MYEIAERPRPAHAGPVDRQKARGRDGLSGQARLQLSRRLAQPRAGARLPPARWPAGDRGARQGRARGAGREGPAVRRGRGGAGALGVSRRAAGFS